MLPRHPCPRLGSCGTFPGPCNAPPFSFNERLHRMLTDHLGRRNALRRRPLLFLSFLAVEASMAQGYKSDANHCANPDIAGEDVPTSIKNMVSDLLKVCIMDSKRRCACPCPNCIRIHLSMMEYFFLVCVLGIFHEGRARAGECGQHALQRGGSFCRPVSSTDLSTTQPGLSCCRAA